MLPSEIKISATSVCDLNYLNEMMGHKDHLIKGIMEAFLIQVPEELTCINQAIEKCDYPVIKSYAHTMKSSVSIMGITLLTPILHEMEELSGKETDLERIEELRQHLNDVCALAINEIEIEKRKYN